MERPKQQELIKTLILNVQGGILEQADRIPEEWDGIELRWFIADHFSEVVFGDIGKRKGKRYQDYKNECLVNNLI